MTMLKDGLADAGMGPGAEREVVARDISELLVDRIAAAGATGRSLPVV
jgi:hypothetical protein